jgi:hypothetical protein
MSKIEPFTKNKQNGIHHWPGADWPNWQWDFGRRGFCNLPYKMSKRAFWRSFGGLLDFSYGMSQRPFDLSCEKYENLNYINIKNWTAWYRSIDDIVYMFLTFLSCFIASYFIGTLSNLCMANKRIYCCILCLNGYKYYDDDVDVFFSCNVYVPMQ